MAQPAIDKQATNVEPTGEEQPENIPKEPVEQNGMPKPTADVEMVDITISICFIEV